ncbi:MAG: sodium-dependent transporter [Bacteroidaceae bacterium]|nr:sodium-dependent transporter [Bacteroidaceae bacterium]
MSNRGSFGSKIGVVLAAAGSAVGLGNVWRFPTEVGNNGGAAFILIYLFSVFFIGVPVMISEFVIGRNTHANTITAFRKLAPKTWWRIGGIEGVFVAFFISCYYIVVSGWTLHYTIASFFNRLSGDQDYKAFFNQFVSSPWEPIVYTVVFMLMTHFVIVRGVERGIERFSKLMMPMLLLIIAVLVICSFSMSGFAEGITYLLRPDFAKVTPSVVLSAVGQAFYSLSLAMGCLCTYASYFGPNTNLMKTAMSVSVIDTCVAILCGFIIFPAVFSVPGVEPGEGPGLVFITLPHVFNIAFHNVPLIGFLFSSLFYLLLLLSALTSAISLHEPVTAYIHEEWHVSRHRAACMVTAGCILLAVACSLSMGVWNGFRVGGLCLFDLFDFISAKIILPMGGIIICLFVGWRLDRQLVYNEVTNNGSLRIRLFRLYIFLVRWVAPLAISVIFINELFLS